MGKSMESENLGRRIRAYRKLKGYTQESFAKNLHISVSVLGEVERGNRVPSEDLVQSIAQELNITVEELIPPELKREEVNN
jgi:transcriptional regulator with XRE-family HTH domain